MCTATDSEIKWEWLHWKKAMPDSGSQWNWQNILDIFLFSVFVMLSVGVTVCLCLCIDKYIILICMGYESSVDWNKPWIFYTSPTYFTTKDETITWLQSNTILELLPYPHRRNIWYDISKIYRVSLLSCPRVQQLYRIKNLHLPGHLATAAVLRDMLQQKQCTCLANVFPTVIKQRAFRYGCNTDAREVLFILASCTFYFLRQVNDNVMETGSDLSSG